MPLDAAWAAIFGAGIGALGTSIAPIIKHFSDVRQKNIDRRNKLEDDSLAESRERRSAREKEEKKLKECSDKLLRLRERLIRADETYIGFKALDDLQGFIEDTPGLLAVEENATFLRKCCPPSVMQHARVDHPFSSLPPLDKERLNKLVEEAKVECLKLRIPEIKRDIVMVHKKRRQIPLDVWAGK